jgi:hypothetical protein
LTSWRHRADRAAASPCPTEPCAEATRRDTPRQQADWLVFLALGVMWGSSYLFIKIGIETVTPLTLVALRLGIGALILAAVVLVARERLPRSPVAYLHLTVMATLNIVVPFSLITWAEISVPSSLAPSHRRRAAFAVVIAAGARNGRCAAAAHRARHRFVGVWPRAHGPGLGR